jgi:heat shock protein HslJ
MSLGAATALAQSPAPYPLDVELPLTEMAGTAVSSDAGITITFGMDAYLSGSSGCNTYSATWQSDGTTLTVGPIAATRAHCGTDVDALESRYLGLLQVATSWSLNGSALEVVTSAGSTLVYGGNAAEPAIVGAWQLSTSGGTPVPNGIVATAVFGADGTLTGTGGCNTYSASYTLDGSSLSIGPLAATRLSCTDNGAIEPAYLDTLQGATSWSVAGDNLTIEGTTPLVFTNGASAEVTLTGQPWALVTRGGQTIDPSLGVSATFGDDGTVSGFGGCNEYDTTYTIDGAALAIEPVAATRKTCAANVDATESAFFTALEGAASLAITGADLIVTTRDGSELAFHVQDGPLPTPGTSAAPTAEPTAAPTAEPTAGPTPAASAPGSPGATATIVGARGR